MGESMQLDPKKNEAYELENAYKDINLAKTNLLKAYQAIFRSDCSSPSFRLGVADIMARCDVEKVQMKQYLNDKFGVRVE